jgi:hypothetical protein
VKAIDLTNDLTNVLNQMTKNLNLDAENPFEVFSEDFSSDNDQDDQTVEELQSQAPRRSGRERKASKLAEGIIQYDPRKKMPRANVIIENKFAYKKVPQCYTHIIKVLVTLINSDDQSNDQFDESQILNEAMQRSD